MLISVVIPTFNRCAVLMRALDSVYAQLGLDELFALEIIVVDDGSEDDTFDQVSARFPQVRLFKQSNQGVSQARNLGIEHAKGQWIALLDSDDEWLPHKLLTQLELLQSSGRKLCHTEEIWIRNGVRVNAMNKHRKYGGAIYQHCLPLCCISPSSVLIARELFDQVGVFDPELPVCEDYDLWLRICATYEVDFVERPCIKKYGGHADQLSRRYWGMDRYRVIALEKMMRQPLSAADASATQQMLLEKLRILHQGAIKHNNTELQYDCQQKLARWQTSE